MPYTVRRAALGYLGRGEGTRFWGHVGFIFKLTVNLFLVLQGTEDAANTTCRVVLGLIFGFKGEDGLPVSIGDGPISTKRSNL